MAPMYNRMLNELAGACALMVLLILAWLTIDRDSRVVDASLFFVLSAFFLLSYYFSERNFLFRFFKYLCVHWTLFGARKNAFVYAVVFFFAGLFEISKA